MNDLQHALKTASAPMRPAKGKKRKLILNFTKSMGEVPPTLVKDQTTSIFFFCRLHLFKGLMQGAHMAPLFFPFLGDQNSH